MTEKKMTERQEIWRNEAIAALLLMGFAFFINRGIEIKGLYMDDLYLWSCYGEQSFGEFVFPIGTTRFRFIYYLAAWLELALTGTHIEWFVPVNIILNTCIAYTVYRFGKRLSHNYFVGFGCGFMYLASRMSYYQISQVYGLMESLALWAAIGIFYCVYRYIHAESPPRMRSAEYAESPPRIRSAEYAESPGDKYFIWANILYFSICFIHERYMVLLPFLYLALLLKRKRKKTFWLVPVSIFLVILAIRQVTIGTISPAGTGGTDVADTFSIMAALRYAVSQVLYVFGINAGPDYLNGMSWGASPSWIRASVVAADIVLAILVILAVLRIVKDKEGRKEYLKDVTLFLVFIALCIGCSSVTIRVEVRWVYVSMTAAYLLAAYLFGIVTAKVSLGKVVDIRKETRKAEYKKAGWKSAYLCGILLLFYVVIMTPVENFYRGHYDNIYFWGNQERYNSLAEETFGKYGEEIFGKQVYILENTYEMSDFTARTFFKTFDRARKAEGTEVHFIDTIQDIGLITDNMLVLKEDPEHRAFQDITEFVRNLKCEAVYGYYRDGWMEESAKVRVMTGKSGQINLEIYYPGELTGKEMSVISLDGEVVKTMPVNQNTLKLTIEAEPEQFASLSFENNFYYKDAAEQRGEKRFSMIVNITVN